MLQNQLVITVGEINRFYMQCKISWLQHVVTIFLTRVKEGDFCEEKVADLEETKRCTVLESADGVRPMDQGNMP